jgi:hypothetical protein
MTAAAESVLPAAEANEIDDRVIPVALIRILREPGRRYGIRIVRSLERGFSDGTGSWGDCACGRSVVDSAVDARKVSKNVSASRNPHRLTALTLVDHRPVGALQLCMASDVSLLSTYHVESFAPPPPTEHRAPKRRRLNH